MHVYISISSDHRSDLIRNDVCYTIDHIHERRNNDASNQIDYEFSINDSSEQLVIAIIERVEVMDLLKINCEWSCHMDKPLAFLYRNTMDEADSLSVLSLEQ